jgi:hypothetical protein
LLLVSAILMAVREQPFHLSRCPNFRNRLNLNCRELKAAAAASPRREQIRDHLREQGIDGAAAAQIAAHHTRDRKELLSPDEVLRQHRELAAQHGHQADHVVAQARERGQYHVREPEMQAQRAVTWARDHLYERGAVQDRRAVLGAALERGMGETTYAGIRQEFERRVENGEFREVSHVGTGHQYTTAAMIGMEREIVARMQEGNRRGYIDPMLVSPQVRIPAPTIKPSSPKVAAGEIEAKRLLLLMDADKSGKVSRAEFMSFMAAEFDRLDTNHDGELDVKELEQSQLETAHHGGTHR